MADLLNRTVATMRTVDLYATAAFKWGVRDCARMAAAHVRHMGHKSNITKAGTYGSKMGAIRALKRLGFDTLEAALDARFERIPPAMALVGDILALKGDDDLSALAVKLDNGNVLHSWQGGFGISEPAAFLAAWRVPCLKVAEVDPL